MPPSPRLFCDLPGFTAFAEYQAPLGRLISAHGGTLEHFAGDGLMVLFGQTNQARARASPSGSVASVPRAPRSVGLSGGGQEDDG